MKILLMALTGSAMFMVCLDDQRHANYEDKLAMAMPVPNDSEMARQAVNNFLSWYKNNVRTANSIQLVNQEPGKPYSVNFKNGERYLTFLRGSKLLTDHYLNEWRIFFKERDQGFRLSQQVEGPPTGFDYDLVLLNQDVDMQLNSLNTLQIGEIKIHKDRATVSLKLQDDYEFRLVRQDRQWFIDEILNLSQE